MSDRNRTTFRAQELRLFVQSVFERLEVPTEDAAKAAEILVSADLRGIDSHGVARLHSYVGLLEIGRINPRPDIRVVRETDATATLDGDNGLGLVVAPRANRLAQEKALVEGSGWVAVRNTNHYGIAGYYVLEALERDLIGISMTNTTRIVAPLWGGKRMLGTNPMAIAFPCHDEAPVVIDMATSTVAFGKVEMALQAGRELPLGWGIDAGGYPTVEPSDVVNGGALLPLGSERERGGHKGFCLSAVVDILSAVLSGANYGPYAPPFVADQEVPETSVGKGIGHFFGALRIDGFADPDEFRSEVDEWIRTFRKTRPAAGTDGPLVPGDPEQIAYQRRRRQGIPITGPVVDMLGEISRRLGIPLDGVSS